MKILYFSWIKDKLAKSEDNITIDENIKTVDDLIKLLKNIDDNYYNVFADMSLIKVSINMETCNFDDKVSNKDEVAFFPPMTGG
jgi:molybdopterin synthase sulfur carrier subunit